MKRSLPWKCILLLGLLLSGFINAYAISSQQITLFNFSSTWNSVIIPDKTIAIHGNMASNGNFIQQGTDKFHINDPTAGLIHESISQMKIDVVNSHIVGSAKYCIDKNESGLKFHFCVPLSFLGIYTNHDYVMHCIGDNQWHLNLTTNDTVS